MSEHTTTGRPPAGVRCRAGILVHGYNLNAEQWESVVWGEPPDRAGRVPTGVFVALCEQAEVLVFGSGASEKNGLLESEATVRLLRERFDDLADFSIFRNRLPEMKHQKSVRLYRERIETALHLDKESKNTRDEIARAGRVFMDRDVGRVVLVSSPTHLPRCLRDASAIYEGNRAFHPLRRELYAAPSVTAYPGYSADDVAIFEPPHRPDRSGSDIGSVVARVHHIPEPSREQFIQRLDDLLKEFEV